MVPGGKTELESKDESKDKPGPNEQALEATLQVMGREEDVDAARFQMLRSLAKAVDCDPTKAALWKEYREALTDLMRDADDADKGLEEALDALRSASEMGNAKNR